MFWPVVVSLFAVVVLAVALAALAVRRARQGKAGEKGKVASAKSKGGGSRRTPVSLAVLLGRPLPLDEELVAAAVERAFGARPTHNEQDVIAFAGLITDTVATVQVHGHVLAVISIGEPYAKDRDWYVRADAPPELVEAWENHRAWLSVDLVYAAPHDEQPGEVTRRRSDEIYAFIGKLLVELAGDETGAALVAFRPGKRHAIIYDDETRTLLRRSNPLKVVTGPLASLVLLETSPRSLDTPQLRAAIERAWEKNLPAFGAADFAAVPETGYGVIAYEGIRFGVLFQNSPYVEDLAGALDSISDLRLRDAVGRHKAWISVDMVEAPVGVSRARVYDLMGRLLAEWIGDSSLLLFAPEAGRAVPIEPGIKDKLGRGGESVLKLFKAGPPPVLSVGGDDPRMEAAVVEARRRLPEFVDAFNRRRGDQHFAVKRKFGQANETEFMWILLTAINVGTGFFGVLDNEPYRLKGIKIGDQVSCAPSEVVDWLYTDGAKVVGNFTAAVLAGAGENAAG